MRNHQPVHARIIDQQLQALSSLSPRAQGADADPPDRS